VIVNYFTSQCLSLSCIDPTTFLCSVQANFYIKGFYGEPETPITTTPLAYMMDAPDNTAFVHPVTGMVVFQKWNLFGRGYFYRHVLGGLAGLLFLIMGFVRIPSSLSRQVATICYAESCASTNWLLLHKRQRLKQSVGSAF
jgi:hypothetical protein